MGLLSMNDYVDPAKPQYKWYYFSKLTFKGDSVFWEQSPVAIFKKDTVFSASDGGFYSYHGTLTTYKGKTLASLTLAHCDYCPMQMIRFTPPNIMDDYDTSRMATNEKATNADPSKEIENPKLKSKTFFIEATEKGNTILVNGNIFRLLKK